MAIVNVATANNPTRQRIEITFDEDANAADTVQVNILTLLAAAGITGGPLLTLLNNGGVAFGNQAAARAAVWQFCAITVLHTAAADGGGGSFPEVGVDPNVAGAAVGNFRLDLTGLKANALDTASYLLALEYRHSIAR